MYGMVKAKGQSQDNVTICGGLGGFTTNTPPPELIRPIIVSRIIKKLEQSIHIRTLEISRPIDNRLLIQPFIHSFTKCRRLCKKSVRALVSLELPTRDIHMYGADNVRPAV